MNTINQEHVNPTVLAQQEQHQQHLDQEVIELRAENCIKNHVIAAMGVGLIPSGLVDVIGITVIEVKLIRK